MTEQRVNETLRQLQFLRGFPDDLVDELASIARMVEFQTGSIIFRQGEVTSMLHLVVAGDVSLEICAPGVGCKKILTIGPGELLGWSPVLGQDRMTATARSVSTVRAIELNGSEVLAICERNPRFGYQFMRRAALALAKRLSATRLQLLDVFGTEKT